MTITFLKEDAGQRVDLLAFLDEQFTEAAEALASALRAVKRGNLEEAKAAAAAVRDLKAGFQLIMEERAKVEKLRRQVAGGARDGALDLAAARDEIGERLARLRAAGGGGGVPGGAE